VVSRRSPDMIALDLLDCVECKGKVTKWDLIKVLGNEVQFTLWIERFFLPEKVLVKIEEGEKHFYVKTERGELFHLMLKNGHIIKLFNRISGKRLS
jgi:predicted transcriptional regulator